MSAGRRNGLSAADSNAERVNVRCSKRPAARSTASRTVAGGSASSPASSSKGRPPASARRGAQAGDRLAVALGALALLLDLAEQVLAVRPDGLELAEQRLVRGQPVVRRLAGRGLGRGVLRLLAALGEPRLGIGGAGLGARDLGLEADRAAGLLVALDLGRLAPAARRLGLAAEVLDRGSARAPASARGRPCRGRGARPRAAARAAASLGPRRRRGSGPRSRRPRRRRRDAASPRSSASPARSAARRRGRSSGRGARGSRPPRRSERDLAQPRVGLGASRPARRPRSGPGRRERPPRLAAARRRCGRRSLALGIAGVRATGRDGAASSAAGAPPFCSRCARLWLFFAT